MLRVCKDCGEALARPEKRTVYCPDCKAARRREVERRSDRKRAEKRKEYTRTPEARARNRAAVKRYSRTEKGRANKARQERHPRRIIYQQRYAQEHKPVFFRCPADVPFEIWMDWIVVNPPKPLPDLCREYAFYPLTVPDYLKSK